MLRQGEKLKRGNKGRKEETMGDKRSSIVNVVYYVFLMLTHQRREHIVDHIYILQRLPSVTRLPDDKNETYKNFQSLQQTKISLLYITKFLNHRKKKSYSKKYKLLKFPYSISPKFLNHRKKKSYSKK